MEGIQGVGEGGKGRGYWGEGIEERGKSSISLFPFVFLLFFSPVALPLLFRPFTQANFTATTAPKQACGSRQ